MNKETKDLIKTRISDLNGLISVATEKEAKAKEEKILAVTKHQNASDYLDALKLEKQKIKEDLDVNP